MRQTLRVNGGRLFSDHVQIKATAWYIHNALKTRAKLCIHEIILVI